MAIDTSLIQDTDWLACTDTDGITYKVSGAAFKNLFKEPVSYEFTVNVQDKEFYISTQTRAEYNGYDTTVDWGDSTVETITTPWNRTHRYLANGIYNIKITVKEGTPFALYGGSTNDQYKWLSIDSVDVNWNWGSSLLSSWQSCRELTSFPLINPSTVNNFQQAWENCSNLTSFPAIDTSNATSMEKAWFGCSKLTSFPLINTASVLNLGGVWTNCFLMDNFPLIDTSLVTQLIGTWQNCSAQTSFPLIDTSSVVFFDRAWSNNNALASFPQIDTALGTNFRQTWERCFTLTSFPQIDTSLGKDFKKCWLECSGLTSFPLLDTGNGTDFESAWQDCSDLTAFPPSMFDVTGTLSSTAFTRTFQGCALTVSSIENVLTSLDANGQASITLGIDAGTNAPKSTWTAAANTAYDSLIAKGWTIAFNP